MNGGEAIEVHTVDGLALRATVREPKRGARMRGTAVLAHAMFARRSEWEKGLAPFLAERGWRTIAFDFRGHGESGTPASKGGSWTYADLVARDLPAVIDGARARARRRPVILVGHSLGGHVALASHATGAAPVDGVALLASNVWLRALEPSPGRWAVKYAVARAMEAVCQRRGFFPARTIRLGSDDEAAAYAGALWRAVSQGYWGSDDGAADYWDLLRGVRIPLFALASTGDSLNCNPECAARFALRAAGKVTIDVIRSSDAGGAAPGHMEIVTTAASRSAWARLEAWMRGVGACV
jgi:predicted alpha/beta hydrolase